MDAVHSDALVFFGATGDLAYKKIFPSLHSMVKRGHLKVPIIGVAKAGWGLEQLRARARDSVAKHGVADDAAFEKLSGLLRYVDGDYADIKTFERIRAELGDARRPAHYFAIPPSMFPIVVKQLAETGSGDDVIELQELAGGHADPELERGGIVGSDHPPDDRLDGRHRWDRQVRAILAIEASVLVAVVQSLTRSDVFGVDPGAAPCAHAPPG